MKQHNFVKKLGKHDLSISEMTDNIERVIKFAINCDNISKTALQSHSSYNWYKNAKQECQAMAKDYNQPLQNVIGIVAALSPGVAWKRNLIDAELILKHGKDAIVTAYGHNKRKALRILNGENSTTVLMPKGGKYGFKVFSFYTNIMFPDYYDAVTIDRHAWRIANFNFDVPSRKLPALDPNRYEWISQVYRIVADKYNVLPNAIQAITWETAKYWYQKGIPQHV